MPLAAEIVRVSMGPSHGPVVHVGNRGPHIEKEELGAAWAAKFLAEKGVCHNFGGGFNGNCCKSSTPFLACHMHLLGA